MKIHRSLIYILRGIMLNLLLVGSAFSQLVELVNENVLSSGRFYYNSTDSVLYTNSIVVKFNQNVIDVPSGHRVAQIINVEQNNEDVRGLLNDIESHFGKIIIIKQVKDASPGDLRRFNRRTGEEIYIHDFSQLFTLKFSNPVPLVSTISMFKNLDVVEYAHEPISIMLYETPNDEFYPDQWNLSAVEASSAWDITIGNANIVVGIVDEGTMQDHEDLVGKIIGGDEIEGEHGTWVSGVAGADTDNGIGIASLGWNLSLRTYGVPDGNYDDVEIEYMSLVEKIGDASEECDVINMSWGTFRRADAIDYYKLPDCDYPGWWADPDPTRPKHFIPESYPEVEDAIEDAIAMGVICIASGGNGKIHKTGPDEEDCNPMSFPFESYPAQYNDVIAVSGTMLDGGQEIINEEWNYGDFIDISAPGVDILVTHTDGGYTNKDGTSFSAPLVSALAGLILSVHPEATVGEVTNLLTSTADKIDATRYPYNSSGWNDRLGHGRVNAYAALCAVFSPDTPANFQVENVPNGTGLSPELTWTSQPNITGYELVRSWNGGPYGIIAWPAASATSYMDGEVFISRRVNPSTVHYKLRAFSLCDQYSGYAGPLEVNHNELEGWKQQVETVTEVIPDQFNLYPNHPNPFNPITTITYDVPEISDVKVIIYDIVGREVIQLVNSRMVRGTHGVVWDGNDKFGNTISSGLYIYRLKATSIETDRSFTNSQKMLLLR